MYIAELHDLRELVEDDLPSRLYSQHVEHLANIVTVRL
jgi:hypothetical protein